MKLVSSLGHFTLISLLTMTSVNAGSNGSVTYAPFTGENIPTLSGWMLILLSLLLMLVAFRTTKHKQSGANKLFITLLGVSLLSLGSGAFQIQNNLVAAPPPELSEPAGGTADVFENQLNTLENTSGVAQRITNVDVTSIQCDSYVGDGSVAGECIEGLVVGTGASCTVDCTAIPTTGNIVLIKNVTQGNPDEPTQRFSIGATNGDDFTLGTGLLANNRLNLNDLEPDTYTVSEETLPTDWNLNNISCSSATGGSTVDSFTMGDTSLDVNLVAGDTVTCTFTNTYAPPLAIAGCTLGTSFIEFGDFNGIPLTKFRWNLSLSGDVDAIADERGGTVYVNNAVFSSNSNVKVIASINPVLNLNTNTYTFPSTLRVDLKDDLSRIIGTCSTELTVPVQPD